MPPKVILENGYSSDSDSDDEPLKYEEKHRIPKPAITEANLDQILIISTGVHRGVSVIAKPLLKTGNLISHYATDMSQLVRSMKTWVKAHKKEIAFILAGIIILALCLAMPVILGAIGFGAQGPIIGSIAAAWQASIGSVAAGSLFSFLQAAAMGGAAMGLFTGFGVLGAIIAMIGAATTVEVVKGKCQEVIGNSAKKMTAGFQQAKAGAGNIWQHSRSLFSKKRGHHDK